MTSSNAKSLRATLTDPTDWDSWSHEFETHAVALHLWSHIDPTQHRALLTEPQEPLLSRYERRAPPSQGTLDTPVDDDNAGDNATALPTSAADLSAEGRAAYQVDNQRYMHQDKKFQKQQDEVHKLKDWVMETVAPHYVEVACKPSETLATWYTKLKEQVGISAHESKLDARRLYKESLKPLSKNKEWNNWLKNWEKVITLAEKKKVPDALDTSVWVEDFIIAVKPVAEYWGISYKLSERTRIKDGQLTFRDLANDFRAHMGPLVIGKGTNPRVAKGSFGPSYAGQDDPDQGAPGDAQEQGAEVEKLAQRKDNSTKRKRAENTGLPYSACGQKHSLSSCFYVFPEKAPRWFHPKKEISKEVEEKLATDASLQEQVQEIKAKQAKRQKTKGKSTAKDEDED